LAAFPQIKDCTLRIPSGQVRQNPWRYLLGWFVLYVTSIGITVLLAPWLQKFLWNWHSSSPSALSSYLVQKPFGKIFDRARWLPMILGVLYFLKVSGLLSLKRLGVTIKHCNQWIYFFVLGTSLTFVICAAQLMTLPWEMESIPMGEVILRALGSAFLVSLLEEIIFRALLLRLFYNALGLPLALILESLFFAYVHFKVPGELGNFYGSNVTLAQSASVGWGYLVGIGSTFHCVPFFSLFTLGCLLSLFAARRSNLMAPMGFHCGLVFTLLFYRKIVCITGESPHQFIGTNLLIDSTLGLLLLLALLFYHLAHRSAT
jgi:membrane protease YdiL (CAAX protease family)